MGIKLIRLFIYSAGAILLAAALDRFFIAMGDTQFLALPEPILGIPLRFALLVVGGLELLVALICLFGRQTSLQLGWLAWLATNYLIYRIGLVAMHCQSQASCISGLGNPLQLTRGTMGGMTAAVPLYLLLGSFTALVWLWAGSWLKMDGGSLKMSCSACGGHIRFSTQNVGRKITCPHCWCTVTLRKPENLKMPCPDCQGHIEFPSHALGQKTACPHCNKNIILNEAT